MPITGTLPPLLKITQGVQNDSGTLKMQDDGDNRYVEIPNNLGLYLNTGTLEIVRRST